MLKRMIVNITAVILMILSLYVHAGAGLLFNVTTTGTASDVSITLCLNGIGMISCQDYTVSALTLMITPAVPNHVYPSIGIKINTPGYTLGSFGLNCSPNSNGFCLFSASQSQPKTISLQNALVANQSITFTSTAPTDAIVSGSTYTPTAISTSGLAVTITVDASSSSVCSISSGVVSFLVAGTCTINANQAGNANYSAATEVQQPVTVHAAAPTSTVVYSSLNPSVTSNTITLSANVSSDNGVPIAGTVGFTANGLNIEGCTAAPLALGIATCTTSSLAAGTSTIVATYTGGLGFATSTSASYSQSVVATVTTTVPAAPSDVTVTPGNGQVTVKWDPPANTGGKVITGYKVNYGSSVGTTYTSVGCSNTNNLFCVVNSLTNTTPYTFTVVATNTAIGVKRYGPAALSSSTTPESVLTVSSANLALSGLGSGTSRSVIISNNSASNVTIASVDAPWPSLPSGTMVNTSQLTACASGAELAANGGFCTITITPGSIVSSGAGDAPCTTGIAPTPSVITVSDSVSDTVSAAVVVLGYGCQFQSGYLFALDDTTPATSSIGGSVVSVSDQQPTSLVKWNRSSGISIWGIDDTSTIANPSPNTSSSSPSSTLSPGQLNCNAVSDGACATNNVFIQYTPHIDYAAGICHTYTIDSLGNSPCTTGICATNWYLPSVCESGPFGSGGSYPSISGPPSSQACTLGSTNIQEQLISTGILTNFQSTYYYWCSTEYSPSPSGDAWYQVFDSINGGSQGNI